MYHEDGEVPRDDLADDADGLVPGVRQLGVVDLNDFAMVLVGPATVVCEKRINYASLSLGWASSQRRQAAASGTSKPRATA